MTYLLRVLHMIPVFEAGFRTTVLKDPTVDRHREKKAKLGRNWSLNGWIKGKQLIARFQADCGPRWNIEPRFARPSRRELEIRFFYA